MAIYDKPIWAPIEDALAELPETFTTDDAMKWFRSKYPKIKEGSIRAHITGMSVNNPTRRYYSGTLDHGVINKIDRYHCTRYIPEHHGKFDRYGKQQGIAELGGDETLPTGTDEVHLGEETGPEAASEFALEQHLEEFMERNWSRIDFGAPLDIWMDPDGALGRQYPTDVGFIDFLCKDRDTGSFVVIELKKGRTSDVVVGQTQRYMGWVKMHLETEGKPVLGLIVVSERDDKLRYALEVAPNIALRLYRVNFELIASEESDVS